jgi:hypothetical protein
MPTRKDQLFSAKKRASDSSVIPATVSFRHNRKKGFIEPLRPHEKMLCALRKVLAQMSDADENGCRYYIANNKVQILKAPSATSGKPGEAKSYHAKGRCRVGVTHPQNHISHKVLEFEISFRDVIDDRGLADVEFFEPTVIDELPRNTPIDVSALA